MIKWFSSEQGLWVQWSVSLVQIDPGPGRHFIPFTWNVIQPSRLLTGYQEMPLYLSLRTLVLSMVSFWKCFCLFVCRLVFGCAVIQKSRLHLFHLCINKYWQSPYSVQALCWEWGHDRLNKSLSWVSQSGSVCPFIWRRSVADELSCTCGLRGHFHLYTEIWNANPLNTT